MECPNCRRVEEGNWLMLGGSQSTDDAIYDVPYDFDDDEYLGLPVDALESEMREVSSQMNLNDGSLCQASWSSYMLSTGKENLAELKGSSQKTH